ncbi:MAG TPA: nucleotidyltransferase domain-containing protein, partial [Actinomycetota bacterium]|nr:nucleotidyltransferase domain-containing protein [Actinomycetota bacterium]
ANRGIMSTAASKYDQYSLRSLVTELVTQCPQVTRAFLFGSRRHRTRSVRSDVDILLEVGEATRPEDVRDFAMAHCRALDFFLIEGPSARSCANGSKVSGASRRDLIRRLDAVEFWNSKSGFLTVDIDWDFQTLRGAEMIMTTLLSAQPFPSKAVAVSTLVTEGASAPPAASLHDHPLRVAAVSATATAVLIIALFESLRVAPLKERIDALSISATRLSTDSAAPSAKVSLPSPPIPDSTALDSRSSARK